MAFYMFEIRASVAIDSTYLTPPGCPLHIGLVVEQQSRWKRLSYSYSIAGPWKDGYTKCWWCLVPCQHEEDHWDSLLEKGSNPPLVMLLYTAGISKNIRWVCKKYDMRVIFTSGLSLRSVLTKVKDLLPVKKRAKVVYHIPYSWSRTNTLSNGRRPQWLTWSDTPVSCYSRKPSTTTWPY